jgi:DedD protein
MGLLDLFRRQGAADAATAAATGEPVEVARARARRRLIGAVVLLGVGVIAFPLLFETQPRPIPVDIPIQIPSREGAAPLAMPASRPAAPSASAPTAALPSGTASASKGGPAAASLPAASAEPRVEPTRTNAPATSTPAPVEASAAPKAPPAPAKAPAPAAAPPAKPPEPAKSPEPALKPGAEAPGRFVVQVGAFAEAAAVREARGKLEKLGLPSYTQVVETSSGSRTRVRLGPFSSREDADKAAAKAKAAGLAGTVLAL